MHIYKISLVTSATLEINFKTKTFFTFNKKNNQRDHNTRERLKIDTTRERLKTQNTRERLKTQTTRERLTMQGNASKDKGTPHNTRERLTM